MISVHQAQAARRLLLFAGALAATLMAHAVAAGGLTLVPAAPLTWGWLAALAVLTGRRRRAIWRRRRAAGVVLRLSALQAALHCGMTAAPWAFGLGVHHRPALVTPLAVLAHGAAVVVLSALLLRADRLLSLAQRAARAVRAALRPPAGRGLPGARVRVAALLLPRDPGGGRPRARGPPPPAAWQTLSRAALRACPPDDGWRNECAHVAY